jgi:hypothetical protein
VAGILKIETWAIFTGFGRTAICECFHVAFPTKEAFYEEEEYS